MTQPKESVADLRRLVLVKDADGVFVVEHGGERVAFRISGRRLVFAAPPSFRISRGKQFDREGEVLPEVEMVRSDR